MMRQGDRVQLEQSDKHLALTMAKMAQGGFPHPTIEKTQQLNKIAYAEVREAKKPGVEFAGHRKVKATIQRHLAMVYKNHMASCHPCQNGTAKNLQTCWGRN
jgi:hypothetical protein